MQSWLFDISDRFKRLMGLMETDMQGEDTLTIQEALKDVYGKEVVPAIQDGISYLKWQEAELNAIEEQIKKLTEIKNARKSRLERVRKGYIEFLEAVGKKKVETSVGNMTVTAPIQSCVVDDVNRIPEKYTRTTITIKPALAEIKKALQNGEEISGVHLEAKPSLRIK